LPPLRSETVVALKRIYEEKIKESVHQRW